MFRFLLREAIVRDELKRESIHFRAARIRVHRVKYKLAGGLLDRMLQLTLAKLRHQ
jgi:hypothetical protein